MNFNLHLDKAGRHATFSPSAWRWINDDNDALVRRLSSQYAQTVGTILHEIACKHIKYSIKMNKYDKKNVMLELLSRGIPGVVVDMLDFDAVFENLMTYVNDGVAFRMTPEVVLYYSDNFFGTTDAISYDLKSRVLRIHDYKSGVIPAHMEQLEIYEALFCLEYRVKPFDISEMELRIYQNNEVLYHNPEPNDILAVSDKIVSFDKFLNQLEQEG